MLGYGRDSSGLVGPIRESAPLMTESLPECEAGCDVGGLGDMVDFVRQWAQARLICALVVTAGSTGGSAPTVFMHAGFNYKRCASCGCSLS